MKPMTLRQFFQLFSLAVISITLLLSVAFLGVSPVWNEPPEATPTRTMIAASPTPAPTATPISPLCGAKTVTVQSERQINYTTENSGIADNAVRTLSMGKDYLGLGFWKGGMSLFTGAAWHHCFDADVVVNSILFNEPDALFDSAPTIWVGTDGLGVESFADAKWAHHTETDQRVYDLAFNNRDSVCATTWEGVYCHGSMGWSQIYSIAKGNILQDHIHTMACLESGDCFFGSISQGGTWLRGTQTGFYPILLTADVGQDTAADTRHVLGGNNLRRIRVNPYASHEIWFVSDTGSNQVPAVVMYDSFADTWRSYLVPNNAGQDIGWDHFGRLWVATSGGTFMFNHGTGTWKMISNLPSFSVAMGCDECFVPKEVYFVGTQNHGLLQGYVVP